MYRKTTDTIKASLSEGSDWEAIRTEWLRLVRPGDFGAWVSFDGSSVVEVVAVDDESISFRSYGPSAHEGATLHYPRNGTAIETTYGGFHNYLGPVAEQRIARADEAIVRADLKSAVKSLSYEDARAALNFITSRRAGESDPAV